ncbi:MAG: hypothetical protein EAX96_11750 [Candidatus Lokiarchaeota archaeon]|nr:hypothetical protein [Candidatus Lokiarchaeota archaeon]
MPKGLVMVRWDDKVGIVAEGKYPDSLVISEDQMMRIFTTHAMGGGEAGFLTMMIEGLNIASYYTGLPEEGKDQFYLALILNDDENPDAFEEGLTETLQILIPIRKKPEFKSILSQSYKKIPKYLKLTEEQRYSFIFKNPNRALLLRKLTEGAIPKEILRKWLGDRIGDEILDLDGLLEPFVKTDIVKTFKIKLENQIEDTECLFLIKDVFFMRRPLNKFIEMAEKNKLPKELKNYKTEVETYFKKYKLVESDARESSIFLSDPLAYEVNNLLRNEILTREEIQKKLNVIETELTPILKDMKKLNYINEFKDENDKKIYLVNDFFYKTFFPEYMVDSIRRRWGEKNISQILALRHLQLLKGIFQGLPADVAMFGPKAVLEAKKAEEKEKEEREKAEKARIEAGVPKVAKVKKVKKIAKVKETEKEEIIDKEMIKKLWAEFKDETVKVKRAITSNLFDVALAPLERAKAAIKKLQTTDEPNVKEKLAEIEKLETVLYKKLKITKPIGEEVKSATTAPAIASDEEKSKLRKERETAMVAAKNALEGKDFNFAIFNLERAKEVSEKLGEISMAQEIQQKIEVIKKKI